MKTDELIERFIDLTTEYGEATRQYDYMTGNQRFKEMERIVSKLDKMGKRALLLDLLDHDEPFVRCTAAARTLSIDEDRAAAALEKVSHERGLVGLIAKTTLQEWRKGNLKL